MAVPGEHLLALASLDLPDAHGLIVATGDGPVAVGAEAYGLDGARQPFERPHLPATACLPQLQRHLLDVLAAVNAGPQEPAVVRTEAGG